MPRFRFQRDGDRYVVFCWKTDDRIGFVRLSERGRWHWSDTYMAHSGHRKTREDAASAAWRSYQKVEKTI